MGSGAILTEVVIGVRKAFAAQVGVTVYRRYQLSELARDGRASLQRQISDDVPVPMPFVERQLQDSTGPIIAATDHVVAVPESIRCLPVSRSAAT